MRDPKGQARARARGCKVGTQLGLTQGKAFLVLGGGVTAAGISYRGHRFIMIAVRMLGPPTFRSLLALRTFCLSLHILHKFLFSFDILA